MEILVVVAIIAVLVTIVINLTARVQTQSKEQLLQNTFALIDTALAQFQEYGFTYKDEDYSDFKFPLDCNDFEGELTSTLEKALDIKPITITGGSHDKSYSGCEAMYFLLSRVPASRQSVEKISRTLVTNLDENDNPMKITVDQTDYPLFRIIDPWGKTLKYDYYDEDEMDVEDRYDSRRAFPVITSSGPDGVFDTLDDLTNK